MENVVIPCEAMTLLQMLDGGSVGAVVIDPPFHISMNRAENWKVARGAGADPWTDVSSMADIVNWTRPHAEQISRVLRKGGAFVVMGGTQSMAAWDLVAGEFNLHWMAELVILWNTGKPRQRNFGSLTTRAVWYSKGGHRHAFNSELHSIYSNVIVCKKVPTNRRTHPAEKPVELTNFIISLLTKHDDLVVDCFCGSGSTLVSAAQLGRPWLGCDMDERYAANAMNRATHAEFEDTGKVYLWINNRLEEV